VNADYCEDSFVRSYSSFGEVYCANVTNRSRIVLRYENNLSRINNVQLRSGRLVSIRDPEGRSRDAYAFTALYFEDSWEDRTGRFYDSNFYKGFFLGELRGFDKVYEYRDEDGVLQLVIYRIIST